MTDSTSPSGTGPDAGPFRSILRSQYRATLTMLRQTIERCPEDLWNDATYPNRYWHVAYHALFCAHMYLHASHAAFRPWAGHRDEYQFLGQTPSPPHRPPRIGAPYTKDEVLGYVCLCEAFVDEAVDRLDLDAIDCGFPWYRLSKLEHQLVSLRHIQHHAAQLGDRLRARAGLGIDWVGGA
jgi:hypothetical protein